MTQRTYAPVLADSERPRRHDAFDGKRKRAFLDALGKSGCLRDAARRAGVSHQTVYNHQRSDKEFARQCELALDMASTDIELHAWERGVKGVEEPIVYRGEIIGTRLKRSDAMLRMLLQATKPKKYGPNPGFRRKLLAKAERKRIEEDTRREVEAEIGAKRLDPAEVDRQLMEKLGDLGERLRAERIAQGWTALDDGEFVPPGWVRADAGAALLWPDNRAEQIPDSV